MSIIGDPVKAAESIEHLDFDVEKEPEKKVRHYGHPIDPLSHWCGGKAAVPGFRNMNIAGPDAITCVACLHLWIKKGTAWWWQVHCLYYGSTCSNGTHDCDSA